MWHISGPPVTVAHLGNFIQGYLHDIHIEDCICDQFLHKIPIKGGQFMKKFTTLLLGPPYRWPIWTNGDLPNGPILKLLNS